MNGYDALPWEVGRWKAPRPKIKETVPTVTLDPLTILQVDYLQDAGKSLSDAMRHQDALTSKIVH
jgi:hypothetical protein